MYCYYILLIFLTNPLCEIDLVSSFNFQEEADIPVTTKKVLEFCKMNGHKFLTITTMDQEIEQVCMFEYAAAFMSDLKDIVTNVDFHVCCHSYTVICRCIGNT